MAHNVSLLEFFSYFFFKYKQKSSMESTNRTNLIINYLPQTYTDDEMYALFSNYGNIKSCKICRDKNTGYSYGFGFVDYDTPEMAQSAIMSLNGFEIENKRIKVALARPPGDDTKGANLYVSNLPQHYDDGAVRNLFQRYGTIVQTRVLTDNVTGRSKGVGFVLFERKHDAEKAMMELNGQLPTDGTQALNIKFADDNAKKVRPPSGSAQRMGYYGNYNAYSPRPGGPQGGPMRGPTSRMRYNPMSAAGGQNGYGAYAGGYAGGYAPRGRGAVGNPIRGPGYSEYGAGDYGGAGVILFVYNIGVDATEADLWNLFSPYGTVKKVNVIWDHQQNKCKGYGFVTMSTMDEANYAIEYLNGFFYKSGQLQVSIKSDKK